MTFYKGRAAVAEEKRKLTDSVKPRLWLSSICSSKPEPLSPKLFANMASVKPPYTTGAPERRKYGGMQVSEVKRLKNLEDENRRLKKMGSGLMALIGKEIMVNEQAN